MRAFVITMLDVSRCPKHSLAPSHYHEDGSCRCLGENNLREVFARLLRRKGKR